jgi:hypothetical protein
MTDNTTTFYRERYRFPQWKKMKVGWPDGFARGVSDRAAVEDSIAALKSKGAEASIEETKTA